MTLHIRRIKNPFKFLFFPFLPNSTFTWIARLEIVHNSDRFSKTRSNLTSCLGTNSRFCSALANWVRFHVYQNSWLACRAQSLSINISGVLCFNFRYRNWIRNKNKACGFFCISKKTMRNKNIWAAALSKVRIMKLHRVSSCQFFVFWIFTKMRVRGGVEDEGKREQRANQRNLEWKKG